MLDLGLVESITRDDLARNRGQLVEHPLGLGITELNDQQDVGTSCNDRQRHQRTADARIGVSQGYQCTLSVRCRGDNGGMDHESMDHDHSGILADLMERLEIADPAEAPELAAEVADELQRRLQG